MTHARWVLVLQATARTGRSLWSGWIKTNYAVIGSAVMFEYYDETTVFRPKWQGDSIIIFGQKDATGHVKGQNVWHDGQPLFVNWHLPPVPVVASPELLRKLEVWLKEDARQEQRKKAAQTHASN